MPWLGVRDNVAFGLPRHLPRAERAGWPQAALGRVGLARLRRRAAQDPLGRHGAADGARPRAGDPPAVLLLDEPFSALDALTRQALQEELLACGSRTGPTMVLVTHDLDEALYLADRVRGAGRPAGPRPARPDRPAAPPAAARRRGAGRVARAAVRRAAARAGRRHLPPWRA